MSREIKFRCWNKQSEQYERMLSLNCVGGMPTSVCITQWGTKGFTHLRAPNFVLEQYTGLKDKTGQEIYEGDIVKVGNLRPRFEVAYNVPCTKFWMENNELVEEFENWNEETGIEVIGNIHDNPELLKGENND